MADYQLLAHYLCPFARRALYARAFKGLQTDIQEMDMANKPAILLETNPNGSVPGIIVTQGETKHPVYESLEVLEIFDEVGPAPYLYPRNSQGGVDVFKRATIRNRISILEKTVLRAYTWFFNKYNDQTEDWKNETKEMFAKFNTLLEGKTFIADDITGEAVLSAADLAIYPFVEVWWRIEHETAQSIKAQTDLSNVFAWAERVKAHAFIDQVSQPTQRLENVTKTFFEGTNKGMTLPLSFYD